MVNFILPLKLYSRCWWVLFIISLSYFLVRFLGVRRAFPPHERLLIRKATSVRRLRINIRGRFPTVGKLVSKKVTRDKMADVNVFGHACEIFVSQYVIGCTCHNESMLIGLFLTKAFANERKWLFESADTRGRGTLDEPLRSVKHADRNYTGRGPTGTIFVCGILHHCIKRFFLWGRA